MAVKSFKQKINKENKLKKYEESKKIFEEKINSIDDLGTYYISPFGWINGKLYKSIINKNL